MAKYSQLHADRDARKGSIETLQMATLGTLATVILKILGTKLKETHEFIQE